MTKIVVKNGNWEEATAQLAAEFSAKQKAFDAKFNATFGTKPEEPKQPAAPPKEKMKTRAEIIMSKDSSVSVLARSRILK